MLRFGLLVVAFMPLLISGDHHETKDGPCLYPEPYVGNYTDDDYTAVYYGIGTNYEFQAKWECVEFKSVAVEEDGFVAKLHYRDSDSNDHDLERKFKPVAGSPLGSRFESFIKTSDGTYESTSWIFTVVEVHGNAVLEYICKQDAEGAHHEDFYHLYAKTVDVDEDTINVMKEAYDATGDGRQTYRFKHENCDYKLTK